MAEPYRTGMSEMQALVRTELKEATQKAGWEKQRQTQLSGNKDESLVPRVLRTLRTTSQVVEDQILETDTYCPGCKKESEYRFKWTVREPGFEDKISSVYECTEPRCNHMQKL